MPRESRNAAAVRCSAWFGGAPICVGLPSPEALAHRFLHERADPGLFGGGQLLQREGDRPHGAFVEVRILVEAERHVPLLELLRVAEEADDLAVLGIRGHPVPQFGREGWRAGFDDRMEPLAHGAIRSRHRGDLREHGASPSVLSASGPGPAAAFFAACLVVLLADFCVPFCTSLRILSVIFCSLSLDSSEAAGPTTSNAELPNAGF